MRDNLTYQLEQIAAEASRRDFENYSTPNSGNFHDINQSTLYISGLYALAGARLIDITEGHSSEANMVTIKVEQRGDGWAVVCGIVTLVTGTTKVMATKAAQDHQLGLGVAGTPAHIIVDPPNP